MNSTDTLTVAVARTRDVDALSTLIAEAFHDLSPSRWLVDDPHARRHVLPGYFRLFVAYGLRQETHSGGAGVNATGPASVGGRVYRATVNGNTVGAAVWLPVVPGDAELPPSYDRALVAVTGRWVKRFQTFDLVLSHHHPDEPPAPAHAHLTMLAVVPEWQGRGIGSALLDTHHRLLDRHRTPAYLEAADSRSRRLYVRHGYRDVAPLPLVLPQGGPPMWPMWRDPGRPGTPTAGRVPVRRRPHRDPAHSGD